MSENFTAKQREVVARKMGYDGPMQMFDEYLASSPSDAARFAGIAAKRMARGGFVQRYANGGAVVPNPTDGPQLPANPIASPVNPSGMDKTLGLAALDAAAANRQATSTTSTGSITGTAADTNYGAGMGGVEMDSGAPVTSTNPTAVTTTTTPPPPDVVQPDATPVAPTASKAAVAQTNTALAGLQSQASTATRRC